MRLLHFCRKSDLDSIAEKGLYPCNRPAGSTVPVSPVWPSRSEVKHASLR